MTMKKAVIALALLLLLGPFMGLLAIGVLMNPAATATTNPTTMVLMYGV